MKQNETLSEIRRVREEHARACNYDVQLIFEEMRTETERLRREGWKIVSPHSEPESPPGLLREEPPADQP